MSKIVWDREQDRTYETGVDHGVLYLQSEEDGSYPEGYAWNGLTSVSENPSGAESTKLYADNMAYLNLISAEDFGGTIEAYSKPDEFDACDGTTALTPGVYVTQQRRQKFGLCYRTRIGNALVGDEAGYKLHLIYGCSATPSEQTYDTVNDSPEAMTLSYEFTTIPVVIDDTHRPTARVVIDSTKASKEQMAKIEEILYGKDPSTEEADDGVSPRLPLPSEIATIMAVG